jgi:NAD+ kinase
VTLLGVNLGRIGFLTEITPDVLMHRLEEIARGAGRVETRAMIEADMIRAGAESRNGFHALNDVVVGRRAIGRTVQVTVRADETTIGNYRADGIIVATATGSTAYTLSVGGPILHPESRELIVTPVAPHLAPANSVVLPGGSRVEVEIAQGQDAILSVDGQPDWDLSGGDVVKVQAGEPARSALPASRAARRLLHAGRAAAELAHGVTLADRS